MITTAYVVDEVLRNLPDFPPRVSAEWARLRLELQLMEDVVTVDRPAVFSAGKDRPILFSALAWADVLLTLDSADFRKISQLCSMECRYSGQGNSSVPKEQLVVYESESKKSHTKTT